jgi:NitT/TauT family transport system permease protein
MLLDRSQVKQENRINLALRGTILFISILIIWSLLSYCKFVEPIFLPTPHVVFIEGIKLFTERNFAVDVVASTSRVLAGFFISALLAVPLGILMGSSRMWEVLIAPIIGFIRYMPAAAFIPLLILWFGIGFIQKVAIIFISVFFYLILLVADVSGQTKEELIDAALTLGAKQKQLLFKVIIPSSLPGIWDSLRIMMGVGWTMIIVAEMVSAEKGIGAMIIQAQRFLQTPRIIAGIIVIGILGVLFDTFFKVLRPVIFPWTDETA